MTMKKNDWTVNIHYIYPVQILRKHKLDIKRRYLYLTALAFSSMVIIQISNTNAVSSIHGVLKYTVLFVANYFVWVFMIDYIYGAVYSFNWKNKNLSKNIVEALVSLFILLLLHLIITNIIYYSYMIGVYNLTLDDVYKDFKPFVLKSILSRFLDLFIIIVLVKIIDAFTTIQKQNTKVISLENQLHLSQLETLRAQLDPHFLFNTLHTLHALISYDDEKAKSMVIKVTHLLRKMLDQRKKHLITFEEELDYFRSYLEIEQERFHDRLEVKIEVENDAKRIQIPALILQPLIENAFKHGISLIEEKGKIHMDAKVLDENLCIVLSNTIPNPRRFSEVHSTKFGLENLRNRLNQIYGEDYSFSVAKEGGLFVATLTIKKT